MPPSVAADVPVVVVAGTSVVVVDSPVDVLPSLPSPLPNMLGVHASRHDDTAITSARTPRA